MQRLYGVELDDRSVWKEGQVLEAGDRDLMRRTARICLEKLKKTHWKAIRIAGTPVENRTREHGGYTCTAQAYCHTHVLHANIPRF
jgi:hypothetical protein